MSVVEHAIEKLRRASASGFSRSSAVSVPEAAIGALANVGLAATATELPTAPAAGPFIIIDREALRAAGYLPEHSQDRRFADHYRQIKRPLLAATLLPTVVTARSPRLIMMASALSGDGKTFTSINLALSMARERDSSVVLIDGDVAMPQLTKIFGAQEQLGLLDALADASLDINALILPTDVRGLSILPAGKPRDGATELIASARMGEIANRLVARDTRRIALFDSSPLIVSSESRALVSIMGQVVLVVRAGKTPEHVVLDAVGHIGKDASLSLVLNQGRPSLIEGLYGYGVDQSYGETPAEEH